MRIEWTRTPAGNVPGLDGYDIREGGRAELIESDAKKAIDAGFAVEVKADEPTQPVSDTKPAAAPKRGRKKD